MKKRIIFYLIILILLFSCNKKCSSQIKKADIREPAVSGSFYPNDEKELKQMISNFFLSVKNKKDDNKKIRALICPHAGYIYSGPIAASGFSLIKGNSYKKIFIIGPSHQVYLDKPAIPKYKFFKTPLGLVKIWDEVDKFKKEKIITFDNTPHIPEHCIEVELPFLQSILKDITIVPILIGESYEKELSDVLKKYIDEETLIIVSSDLSHYYTYDEAKKLDRQCVETILKNDIIGMYNQEACGKYPIITLMYLAKQFGWEAELIDLRNSGDTSGLKDRVVGYGAIAFYEKNENKSSNSNLSEQEKKYLLTLAREAITKENKNLNVDQNKLSNFLKQNRGCFVTLTINNELRGCVGYIKPIKPLYQAVIDNAYNSAYSDYRFNPVSKNEINDLKIEISILTVPKKLSFSSSKDLLNKLNPLKDGVIINKDGYSATFLPQVWEELPNKVDFLEQLCLKAGLNKDAWQEKGFEVEIYHVEYFKE